MQIKNGKNHVQMAENTKDRILKATFKLLLEKGYDKVLVSDIQGDLGISRGLLYRYFKGKDDLVFAACREYFYDRYFEGADYSKMTLRDFFDHARDAVAGITELDGREVDILRYNTLYSAFIQSCPAFRQIVLSEFEKARGVIRNAIRRGEIENLPENFVGATLLAIFGRTSYITATPSHDYVKKRILEDIEQFYALIKKRP